jgi:phosphatidylglycerophosphate synthase
LTTNDSPAKTAARSDGESEDGSAGREPDLKADCYAHGERTFMMFTQRVRGRLFAPLLSALDLIGTTPNHLTLASLIAGLAFCPVYFWSTPLAFVLLAMHVLLDGLDGPLARHQGIASRRGSFTDTMSDQTVITATTLTLMYARVVDLVPGTLYIFTYAVVVLFAMARNFLETPYSWLIRPRFYVYAWLLVETYLWPATIDYVLWICVAVLAIKLVTGFARIRARL